MSEPIDLGAVRTRMVDLEDNHTRTVSVEEFIAELLTYSGDPDALGRSVQAEVARALILYRTAYRRMGVATRTDHAAAIGFLQGVTFAVAYSIEQAKARWTVADDEAREQHSDAIGAAFAAAESVLEESVSVDRLDGLLLIAELDGAGLSIAASDGIRNLPAVLRRAADRIDGA